MAKSFVVQQPGKEVRAKVVQIMTAKGGTLTAQTDDMIAAAFPGRPNILLVLILLVFGIVPGVIYWLVAKRTKSLLVQLAETDTQTTVTITSGGKVTEDAQKAIIGAFGQKASQKVVAAAAGGTAAAARGLKTAAMSAGSAVSDRVRTARADSESESDTE